MPSLIEELQRDALNGRIPVTELLQKCLVVASKLGVTELRDWAKLELDGYPNGAVPTYRRVGGVPKVYNPFNGYQPLLCDNPGLYEVISQMPFNQPISEIESHINDAERTKSTSLRCSYSAGVEAELRRGIQFGLQPSLQVSISQLRKIVEAVRRGILEWSLKLEEAEIKGEGMSFSSKEKRKAKSVTYHFGGSYVIGNVNQSQIGTNDSHQSVSSGIDLASLRELIVSLNREAQNFSLEKREAQELKAEVQTLEAQLSSPKPKMAIIKETLTSISLLLGNVSSAATLYDKIHTLLK